MTNAPTEGEARLEDQVTATRAYAKTHHLNELFVHLLQLLLYNRPEDPRAFLVSEIRKIREQKVSSSLFVEKDLETMFDLIDVTRQRSISLTQLRNACANLSTMSEQDCAAAGEGDAALEEAIASAGDANGRVTLEKFKEVLAMLLVTKNMWSH